MLVGIVIEIGFGIFNADLATLNSRIYQFGTHIRIQETKLHQNHTLVEKIFFWSKMAFTLHITEISFNRFGFSTFECYHGKCVGGIKNLDKISEKKSK